MSLAAAGFYGLCSGSMSFINKLAMNTYGFNYPEIIMLAQMSVTVAALKLIHLLGKTDLPNYTRDNARLCFLPSLFYVLNSTFALSALSGMNIPMYNVLKRTGPLFYVFLAVCILKKGWPSASIIGAVSLTSAGCVVAGLGDISFDPKAYLFGICSIFLQGIYLTLVQRLGLKDEMSTNGILYINSLNCLPFLIIYSLLTSEFKECILFFHSATLQVYLILIFVVTAGCVLNYSQFLCTTMNSALTTSIVGVVKSVVTTIVGIFAFGGVTLTTNMVLGISMNIVGAFWYTFAKYRESLVKHIKRIGSAISMSEMGEVPTTATEQKRMHRMSNGHPPSS
ncbi:UDP-galactose/UDP-glucose transporter 7-like [Lytechinus variegatus]|uniref:UDP-galactose/UDP-glucose transporter 7-like n=1 Tax=Lytechinus variegatus TaxID=7654 RepID=UPI001BB254CB|nr:UDP-galactose/UDP-glucose transporter 7-like [Lytechinus variegatus]XP_041485431.1 UDP-galactose/UDP-glucose transporter 7-like [Lytechinus variegatus]